MFKKILSLFTLLSLSYLLAIHSTASADDFTFNVNPIPSANQVKAIHSYFDLNVQPGSIQQLSIQIQNLSDKETTIDITPTNALTTKNGGMDYSKELKTENSSFSDASFAISNRIQIQKQVGLNPHETKIINFTVSAPNDNVGVYLGGLLFEKQETDNTETIKREGNASFELKNKSAYAMAIELNLPTRDKNKFLFGNTTLNFFPSGAQLTLEFKNDSATILNADKINFTVLNSQGVKMFNGELSNVKIAPKNILKYPVFWNGGVIAAGNYKISLSASVSGNIISKESTFKVEKKDIDEQSKKVDKQKNQILVQENTPYWMWIIMAILGLTVCGLLFFLVRKNKEK